MFSVTSSAVAGGGGLQASRLALLTKLFQTSGQSTQDSSERPAPRAATPPPPPPPAHPNSAGGLASMFEALQSQANGGVVDLLSRLLQAVDSDGDGKISADELLAVTELTSGHPHVAPATPGDANGPLAALRQGSGLATDKAGAVPESELDQIAASLPNPALAGFADLAQQTVIGQTHTAYQSLFQSLQMVFAQPDTRSALNTGKRYADALQSLAKAG